MTKTYITVVLLYALFVLLYLFRLEVSKKRKKDIVGKGSSIHGAHSLKTDIVGKSKFNKPASMPLASKPKPLHASTEKIESTAENTGNFIPSNKERSTAEIPPEEMDEAFTDISSSEENELSDIDYPLEYESDDESMEAEDEEEEEIEEVEGTARAGFASGVQFEQLGNAVRTIKRKDEATRVERQAAGNTLLELRRTDMFEQLVSGKPATREIVTSLMAESLAAFHRRNDNEAGKTENGRKAPDNFDMRDFA